MSDPVPITALEALRELRKLALKEREVQAHEMRCKLYDLRNAISADGMRTVAERLTPIIDNLPQETLLMLHKLMVGDSGLDPNIKIG